MRNNQTGHGGIEDGPGTDTQAKGEQEGGIPRGKGESENIEDPGHAWRTGEEKPSFKAGVLAVMAGGVILREAITSNMKPSIPEIAHVGRFRVVERLSSPTHKHASTKRDKLTLLRAPSIHSQLCAVRPTLR